MSAPDNAPPNCPRRTDSSSGPRRCPLVACPLHLHKPGARGGPLSPRRVRLLLALDDTCCLDVSERARFDTDPEAPVAMSFDEIAVFTASSRPSVIKAFRRALLKYRRNLLLMKIKGYVEDAR